MLSGEADHTDLGDAMSLGYSEYVHKSQFRKLPALVLREYAKYQNEVAREAEFEPVYLFKVRHLFGLRGATEFWLLGIFVEDDLFIPRDSWRLIDQVSCGEKKRVTERFELVSELKFESTLETEMSSNVEVALKAASEIKAKLGSVLKTKINQTNVLKESRVKETAREIGLPEEPKARNRVYIRSRAFYCSPIYIKMQCHFVKVMRPMNEKTSVVVTIMQPTGKIATKQVDILSNGTKTEIDSGAGAGAGAPRGR